MPVEIKELIIRAVADKSRESDAPAGDSAAASSDHDAIVEQCVKQVLEILRKSRER
ncbi:MAG: DUF5908 family protein [Proteobacteria bacterium]|nr:DUF5908 family protein [Pseudomonadota bacterium]